jgi:myosin heavy subunit
LPDDKLTDKEKAALQDMLRGAALTDAEVRKMAEGEDESGQSLLPVESGEDLLSAAATALDFVEKLDGVIPRPEVLPPRDAVAGFDALLKKLETLRGDISSLQRGVVGVFAAQLLTFRGKVVELKTRISEEMVEKLKMQFFKSFIEATFIDIVDNEFAALEKDLVDKIVEQTQERFKEFAGRVRESELDLRSTIVEQQDIVRSFMQSLEAQIRKLQSQFDSTKTLDAAKEEMGRKLEELDSEIAALRQQIVRKDGLIESKVREYEEVRAQVEELQVKLGEVQSELAVYKTDKESTKGVSKKSDAEVRSLQSKIELLEKAVADKRKEAETSTIRAKELEIELRKAAGDRAAIEKESRDRLKELDGVQSRLKEVKDLEEKVHQIQQELKATKDKVGIVEMQREAFEKATRLMEKERDMALEQRDLSDERTKRYIKVLGMEKNTKVLLLVDEVGSMTFADLAKSLGTQVGLAAKHARELEKLGVLKIDGDKAVSTLKRFEIKEGEVKV